MYNDRETQQLTKHHDQIVEYYKSMWEEEMQQQVLEYQNYLRLRVKVETEGGKISLIL